MLSAHWLLMISQQSEIPSFFPKLTQVKFKIYLNTSGYKVYSIQLDIFINTGLVVKSLGEIQNTTRKLQFKFYIFIRKRSYELMLEIECGIYAPLCNWSVA